MATEETTIENLLERAHGQSGSAVGRLLEFHRQRLRRMVAARLDQRMASRIDPSDIVQDVLLEAGRELPKYIRERPVPFFVWLRGIAHDRVVWWTRWHTTKKRDVFRERPLKVSESSDRAQTHAEGLFDSGTSPSGRAMRAEERARVLTLLNRLGAADRQVLQLRYLDGLSIAAIASALEISLSAAQMRHLRALERLREHLHTPAGEPTG